MRTITAAANTRLGQILRLCRDTEPRDGDPLTGDDATAARDI